MSFAQRWGSVPVSTDLLNEAMMRVAETGLEPRAPRKRDDIYGKAINDRILREFLDRTNPEEM